MTKEKIICSAVWYKDLPSAPYQPINIDTGLVVYGVRHVHCVGIVKALANLRSVQVADDGVGDMVQGFVTTDYRFVNREEAAIIAFESQQIKQKKLTLFSEDLY